MRARFKRIKDFLVRQANAACIPFGPIQIKAKGGAFFQRFFAVREHADPQFRALKIGQNGDGTVKVMFYLTNDAVTFAQFIMGAMAHVQAKHVCAGFVQGADGVVIVRCGPKGRHDLRVAKASHVSPVTARVLFAGHGSDQVQSLVPAPLRQYCVFPKGQQPLPI